MKAFIFTIGFSLLAVSPAQATFFCEVLKTPDGFAALREGPSVKSRLLRKIKTGEQVQVGLGRKGNWDAVIYYLRKTGNPADAKPIKGWINSRLLSDECG
jgi:uncharacterized protein YgiM (DUF1202 family)